MSHRHRLLPAVAAAVIAGSMTAAISACGSVPSTTPTVSPLVSASSSAQAGDSLGTAASLPTYDPNDISTIPSSTPGGSSVQLKTPCDSGTVTLKAYPKGKGVAMTATLRNTAHTRWDTRGIVSPELNPVGETSLPQQRADHGVIVVRGSNLHGGSAVGGVSHAWPQVAEADLYASGSSLSCSNSVFLDQQEAKGYTPYLIVDVKRSGTVSVHNGGTRTPGTWRVNVTAKSPVGAQTQTRSVPTMKQTFLSGTPYYFSTQLTGFTNLKNFTSVTVTASENGKDRTWLTLSHTP